jgi:hypothetical protein
MARVIKKEFTKKPPVFITKPGRISAAEREERQKLTDEYEARLKAFKADAEFIFWSSFSGINPKYIFYFASVQTLPLKNFFSLFCNNLTHFEIFLSKEGIEIRIANFKSLRLGPESPFNHGSLVDNLLQIKSEKAEHFNISVDNISFLVASNDLICFLNKLTNSTVTSIWIDVDDYDASTKTANFMHFGVDNTCTENNRTPMYYDIIIPYTPYSEETHNYKEENVEELIENVLTEEKNEIIENETVEVSFVDIGKRKLKARKKSKIIVLNK